MKPVVAAALTTALLCLGCDLGVQQRSATKTLTGVSASRVASAAQGVLVEEGFDLVAVSSSSGFVRTAWREGPRRQLMFTVSTDEVADEEGNELKGVRRITVHGFARDRLVGGWSEEYQTDHRIDELLGAIADRLTDPADAQVRVRCSTGAPPKDKCASSAECPSGKHCAGRACVSECEDDAGCAEGERCDDKGRCLTQTAPAPTTAPSADTDSARDAAPPEAPEDEDQDEDEEVAP